MIQTSFIVLSFNCKYLLYSITASFAFNKAVLDKPHGLPPTRPLSLAASSPALVLSIVNSLSSSANEANIPK